MRFFDRYLLVALTALAVGLAGCGSPEPDPAPTTESGPSAEQTVDMAADTMEKLPAEEPDATEPEPTAEPVETAEAGGESVTIYRDEWGVPHIYADTDRGAAFGMGYAQAEDRLDDIYVALRTGLGKMSEAFGTGYEEQDYAMRLLKNEELAKEYMETAPEHLAAIAEGFVGGVNAYLAENPDAQPEFALDIEPYMLLTVGRAMILRWPLGTVQDEIKRKSDGPIDGGSNQWAVAPSRSADGEAILLTDPHLTWEGLAVFYEARVRGDKLHMNGFFLMGSPLMAFGHNENVGWAPTTGGPDTADVFELDDEPGQPDGSMNSTESSRVRTRFR